MSKNGRKHEQTEKSVAARFRIEGVPSEGLPEETVEEISIPDYVVRDFGHLEESNGEPRAGRRRSEGPARELRGRR